MFLDNHLTQRVGSSLVSRLLHRRLLRDRVKVRVERSTLQYTCQQFVTDKLHKHNKQYSGRPHDTPLNFPATGVHCPVPQADLFFPLSRLAAEQ